MLRDKHVILARDVYDCMRYVLVMAKHSRTYFMGIALNKMLYYNYNILYIQAAAGRTGLVRP